MRRFRANARDFLLVICALIALAAIPALITRAAFAEAARGALAVHFQRIGESATEALAIFAHNATIMAGLFALVAVVQIARAGRAECHPLPSFERLLMRGCDLALALDVAGNAILAGVLLGAYGARQIRAFLPQGPAELSAWALAIALYLQARRRPLELLEALTFSSAALGVLALAALAEVHPGAL